MNKNKMRLGVNIDHVATLRNARGGNDPSILTAANMVMAAGADFITIHLREDRRHIRDEDLELLVKNNFPINLEIAPTEEMINIALKYDLYAICLVPENRQELTTEGGLDLKNNMFTIQDAVNKLKARHKIISLFIKPCKEQFDLSTQTGATAVEFHLGDYQHIVDLGDRKLVIKELEKISDVVKYAHGKMSIHAGHGLNYFNIGPIAQLNEIEELNIGHSIISESIFTGIDYAVKDMINKINEVR